MHFKLKFSNLRFTCNNNNNTESETTTAFYKTVACKSISAVARLRQFMHVASTRSLCLYLSGSQLSLLLLASPARVHCALQCGIFFSYSSCLVCFITVFRRSVSIDARIAGSDRPRERERIERKMKRGQAMQWPMSFVIKHFAAVAGGTKKQLLTTRAKLMVNMAYAQYVCLFCTSVAPVCIVSFWSLLLLSLYSVCLSYLTQTPSCFPTIPLSPSIFLFLTHRLCSFACWQTISKDFKRILLNLQWQKQLRIQQSHEQKEQERGKKRERESACIKSETPHNDIIQNAHQFLLLLPSLSKFFLSIFDKYSGRHSLCSCLINSLNFSIKKHSASLGSKPLQHALHMQRDFRFEAFHQFSTKQVHRGKNGKSELLFILAKKWKISRAILQMKCPLASRSQASGILQLTRATALVN